MKYEMISGIEVHVELSTKSKIFCSCSTAFGAGPNTHCCPVCTGQPGTLPVLNRSVLEYAMRAGIALNCRINEHIHIDRKNYFYPDLPKAYQISQYDEPICEHGYIELDSGKRIGIRRIHVEEDAGKLVHEGARTLIDYNRTGVPLVEIVSEPDISSSEEAGEYVEKLQLLMRYVGVSDCKMQEGSLRCDVNLSVKSPSPDRKNSRTEIKNLNSITYMVQAMDYEFARQCEICDAGGEVRKATLRYDTAGGETREMRSKEDEQDYRYFPEPDIPAIEIPHETVERIRSSLPELPDAKYRRYRDVLGIPEDKVKLIYRYQRVCRFVDAVVSMGGSVRNVVNLTTGIIYASLGTEEEKELFDIAVTPEMMYGLVKLMDSGRINSTVAHRTLEKMLETGKDVTEFISGEDMEGLPDEELRAVCMKAVRDNPKAVQDYRGGKEKAICALFGTVRKSTGGRADMKKAESVIKEIIGSL